MRFFSDSDDQHVIFVLKFQKPEIKRKEKTNKINLCLLFINESACLCLFFHISTIDIRYSPINAKDDLAVRRGYECILECVTLLLVIFISQHAVA